MNNCVLVKFVDYIQIMDEHVRFCPTVAIVNLTCLAHNVEFIRKNARGQKICAIIKANAYGHGVKKISYALQDMQVDCFGVYFVDEAIYLRNIGINKPIIILGGVCMNGLDEILKYDLTPVLGGIEQLEMLIEKAIERKACFDVHLEIDTGMARFGVLQNNIPIFIKTVHKYSNYVKIVGIMTHMTSAHISKNIANNTQIKMFIDAVKHIDMHENITLHISNSPAILAIENAYTFCNMVRCGKLLYGIQPFDDMYVEGLKPIMELHTKIIALRHLSPGSPVSYNGSYVTPICRTSCIATIPIGYADGYRRNFSNCSMVLVQGKRVPVVGDICMDVCMIDVSTISNPAIGDDVVLIGTQGDNEVSVNELANLANTVSTDIICTISDRVPRKYIY